MTKTFQVVNRKKKGPSTLWIVIRQIPGIDKMYKLGDILPGYGRIIGVKLEAASK